MFRQTTISLSSFRKYIIALVIVLNSHVILASNISDEVKSYITNIKSIAVEFTQTDHSGTIAKGMLIIDKPHKFRCNYYEPFPIVIVGSKNYVSVYDYEMEHLSRIKANENIFHFLLVDNVNFEEQFDILSAKEENGNYVLKLKHPDLNKISEISFDKATKQIKHMKIFEENNVIVLTFEKTTQIKDVSRSLFIMKDPDIFGQPDRLSKDALIKKFKSAS